MRDFSRRGVIGLVGGAAAWPLGARAQQPERVRRVGVLMPFVEADQEAQARLQAFRQGLADFGWVKGRNLRNDERWAGPDVVDQRSSARDLVATVPDVIVVNGTAATLALRDATRTIPIVFAAVSDPVVAGIVANLARPEGNVTGFMLFENSLAGKWLSLLKDVAPRLARVALLFNVDTAAAFAPFYVRAAQEAGERLGLKIVAVGVRDATAIEPAIAAMADSGDGGLLVLPDAFNVVNRSTTIALAAKHRVPAIYFTGAFAKDGGFISYGADAKIQYRDCATYVDRILRGAKPSELPVQFPTKFELVINLKVAKALGLDVPMSVLGRADEVIE